MLLATLFVGLLTAYWFGLRAGGWAAAATFALMFVAMVMPDAARVIYIGLAVGVLGVCLVGPRRARPPDAVRATRWVRRAVGHVAVLLRGRLYGQAPERKRDGDDDTRPPSN